MHPKMLQELAKVFEKLLKIIFNTSSNEGLIDWIVVYAVSAIF